MYVMIDNTWILERISFKDGFFGYNKIEIYLGDKKANILQNAAGIVHYTVKLICLKNAYATYQHAMTTIS